MMRMEQPAAAAVVVVAAAAADFAELMTVRDERGLHPLLMKMPSEGRRWPREMTQRQSSS
jgi:hypothetical protein